MVRRTTPKTTEAKAPRPRIAKRREAKSTAILDAAMRIAVREGVDSLTLQGLAAALDVAVGAIYRYFPSKDAVLAGLQGQAIARLEESLAARDARCTELITQRKMRERGAALLRLLAAADAYATMGREHPTHFRLFSLMLADTHTLVRDAEGAGVLAAARPVLERVGMQFAGATYARAVGPGSPAERAVLYWAGLHGVLQLAKLDRLQPGLFDVNRRLPAMASTLLRGWGADVKDLARAVRLVPATREREPRRNA